MYLYSPRRTAVPIPGRAFIPPYRSYGLEQPRAAAALPQVVAVSFVNLGTTHPDNRCASCPITLGIGVDQGAGPTASNAMELQFLLSGHRPTLEYDITRTRRNTVWERVGGLWRRLQLHPMGTRDDHHNDDESLTPRNGRIFVIDNPGFPHVLLPAASTLRLRLLNGSLTDTAATDIVQRMSFAEWVIVRSRAESIPWSPLQLPRVRHVQGPFFFWHSIVWLRRATPTDSWDLDRVRSRIAAGSLSAAIINSQPV